MSIVATIRRSPALERAARALVFKPKPHSSRVRFWLWLLTIFPRYFNRGVSWRSRLDLVPFHRFALGKDSRIEMGVVVNNGMGDVIIHDAVHTGIGCIILGPVELHKHVGLAQYVRVIGMHHGIEVDVPHHLQPTRRAPIVMEEDAFVGTGSVVLGKKNGDTLILGRYCRVGANAVVTDDIPPYTIAVGNPAKVVRRWDFDKKEWVRVTEEEAERLREELRARYRNGTR